MAGPRMKILLVDHEDMVREHLLQYLKSDERFQIDEASDGFSAVSKSIMKSYHLAILDMTIPHFNGIEALKNMRVNSPELKFILISGLSGKDLAADSKKLGCKVLQKPVKKDMFLNAVYESLTDELESMSKASQ